LISSPLCFVHRSQNVKKKGGGDLKIKKKACVKKKAYGRRKEKRQGGFCYAQKTILKKRLRAKKNTNVDPGPDA